MEIKKEINLLNCKRNKDQASTVYSALSPQLKRRVELAKDHGSHPWLSVLQIEEHDFHLNNGKCHGALCQRYAWSLSNTPRLGNCGTSFSTDHAMTCHILT